MARATYIEPNIEEWLQKFNFFTEIKVRYCETDMSGHINNTSYIVYFEQARSEYLYNIGFFDTPVTVVTADIWCQYHQESFFPDTLQAGVRVSKLGNRSLDLEYYITSSNKKLIATAKGTLVTIDKRTKKSVMIPLPIRNTIEEIEGLKKMN